MTFLDFLHRNARWLAAGFLLSFSASFGQTYFISLFAGEIRAQFNLSHGDFGGLYMAATLASAVTLLWLGKLADWSRLDLVAGAMIIGLGAVSLAMSALTGPAMLLVVLYGLRLFGQGMLSHISVTAMARWYNLQRGRAIAIASLGHPAGEAIFPALAVILIVLVGWRQTWMIAAAALFLIALPLAVMLLRNGRTPHHAELRSGGDRPVDADWTRKQVLADPLFYALLPGLMATSFIITGVFFHQVHLVEVKGWQLAWFAAGYPVYAAATIVSSLASGWVIDRWSAIRVLPVFLLPMAAGLVVLAETRNPGIALAFFALSGLTAGGAATVVGALWAELYGTAHLGAIKALVTSASVGASALAPGLLGWLIDAGIGIETQLLAMAIYTVAVSIAFVILSPVLTRRAFSIQAATPY